MLSYRWAEKYRRWPNDTKNNYNESTADKEEDDWYAEVVDVVWGQIVRQR